MYQPLAEGGLNFVNFSAVVKSLRLAWIGRLLSSTTDSWKAIPNYYFNTYGGLKFLLKCNYNVASINNGLPTFYREHTSTSTSGGDIPFCTRQMSRWKIPFWGKSLLGCPIVSSTLKLKLIMEESQWSRSMWTPSTLSWNNFFCCLVRVLRFFSSLVYSPVLFDFFCQPCECFLR